MLSPFHIFRVHSDGSRRWMEGAASVECARERVKVLVASSPGQYVITNLTCQEIPTKSQLMPPSRSAHPKRIIFQIGYDERELKVRAELFRRCGHEVMSVADNKSAKRALCSFSNVDVFVVGYTAHEETRKEMVDWLKVSFPKAKIVALIPSVNRQFPRADYNVVLNNWDEWKFLLAAMAS